MSPENDPLLRLWADQRAKQTRSSVGVLQVRCLSGWPAACFHSKYRPRVLTAVDKHRRRRI